MLQHMPHEEDIDLRLQIGEVVDDAQIGVVRTHAPQRLTYLGDTPRVPVLGDNRPEPPARSQRDISAAGPEVTEHLIAEAGDIDAAIRQILKIAVRLFDLLQMEARRIVRCDRVQIGFLDLLRRRTVQRYIGI